jgi:DNA-binding CsgD family transcriptional regulator
MANPLTVERVRRDVEVIARGGLDTAAFVEELVHALERVVPHTAACVATMDPATRLLTGTYKFGDLHGNDAHDHEWGLIEYGQPDATSFVELIERELPACAVAHETGGDIARSVRMGSFIRPRYGYGDELRLAARHRDQGWGAIALFRGPDDPVFTEHEVAFMASLSTDFAIGLRAGLLVRLASAPRSTEAPGPAVVIVGADDQLSQLSVGAESLLADIARDTNMAPSTGIIGSLVAGARRYAAGQADVLPRTRVRMSTGRWLVLHASPLSGAGGPSGDVVITIEEARPPEIVPLVVAAFELTARERDVTQLVLQGVDTKEIAATLHMSRYTVQDHLKSVFEKADVRSRRELMSRIYFDQYSPRLGGELAPSGWFTSGT